MIKHYIKKLIGEKNFAVIRAFVLTTKNNFKSKIDCSLPYKVLSQKDAHVFFGYYDIQQLSSDEEKALVHVIHQGADTNAEAKIGYYDKECNFTELCKTRAWCWQQGARLRWHPNDSDLVIYNDFVNDSYVTQVFSINKKGVVDTYDRAFYDIDSKFCYGLSLNFSRLQRLRPGYGYSNIKDSTEGIPIPENDGIYRTDLNTGKTQLLITYERVTNGLENKTDFEHYFNHISFSPDGKRFIFFHIFQKVNSYMWKTRLICSDINGENLNVLEENNKVSHYCWNGSDELLVTCYDENGNQFYERIDIHSGEKSIFNGKVLTRDGHPTLRNDGLFVTDTYPNSNSFQKLIICDNYKDDNSMVPSHEISLFHSPYLEGEKRCDLHPRVSRSGRYISLDTTFTGNKRSCIIIDRKKA